MADDGSGTDITIPTMLMFKQDADRIKAELTKKETGEDDDGMVCPQSRWPRGI